MTMCRCGNTIHRASRGSFCDLCAESGRLAEREYAYADATQEGRDGLHLDGIEIGAYRDPETGRIIVQVRARDGAGDLDTDGAPIVDVVKIAYEEPEPVIPSTITSGTTFSGTFSVGGTIESIEYQTGDRIRIRSALPQMTIADDARFYRVATPVNVMPEDES